MTRLEGPSTVSSEWRSPDVFVSRKFLERAARRRGPRGFCKITADVFEFTRQTVAMFTVRMSDRVNTFKKKKKIWQIFVFVLKRENVEGLQTKRFKYKNILRPVFFFLII